MFHLNQDAIRFFEGLIELDESYLGSAHKGKRSRGAAGKVIIFGLLKWYGKVYTITVPDLNQPNTCYHKENYAW